MKILCLLISNFCLLISQTTWAQAVDDFGSPVPPKSQPQQVEKIEPHVRTNPDTNMGLMIGGGVAFVYGIVRLSQRDCNMVDDGFGNPVQDCTYPGTNSGTFLVAVGAAALALGVWRMNLNNEAEDSKTANLTRKDLIFATNGQQSSVLFQQTF